MTYHFQEGSLAITPATDRTLNILVLDNVGGRSLNLVIARDQFLPDEDLDMCVARQIRNLSRQVNNYKEHARQPGPSSTHPTVLLEISMKKNNQTVYQGVAMMQMPDRQLLVFTLTSPAAFDDALRQQWHNMMDGFRPSALDA